MNYDKLVLIFFGFFFLMHQLQLFLCWVDVGGAKTSAMPCAPQPKLWHARPLPAVFHIVRKCKTNEHPC